MCWINRKTSTPGDPDSVLLVLFFWSSWWQGYHTTKLNGLIMFRCSWELQELPLGCRQGNFTLFFTTLWICCNTVDHAHSFRNWVWGHSGGLWWFWPLLRHKAASHLSTWVHYAPSEGMNMLRFTCDSCIRKDNWHDKKVPACLHRACFLPGSRSSL